MDILYTCEEYYYLCKLIDDSIQSFASNIHNTFLSGYVTNYKKYDNLFDDDELYHVQSVNPYIQYGKSHNDFDGDIYSRMECGHLVDYHSL
jgi:hypothetical protein